MQKKIHLLRFNVGAVPTSATTPIIRPIKVPKQSSSSCISDIILKSLMTTAAAVSVLHSIFSVISSFPGEPYLYLRVEEQLW